MGCTDPIRRKSKNDKMVTLRTVTENDAEAYLALAQSIMAESIYSMTQPDELEITVEQEKDWLRSNIENPNHLVLVAEMDGKVVGQLDFSNGPRQRISHTGEFGMGVHKDYRQFGIGSFLLDVLISWAKCHPTIEKINLCVHHTNDRALSMYKKHGFQREGLRTKDLKYGDDKYVDTVLMGLWVGQ